ncbi:mitochondrial large subunit ribosomal protein-domain-containing protein [Paraphoma chrysanthemicola]|uniref:Large ribosomal subunit protein mL49 n=1 Tax=Paraphoma chrysanthemicola TaxID=798071 RepID=A0A8K0W562_9PLEO|nr:mitochondrial large subunit ribosomal protein-domain-containing protein [Paraphoma chrysanthemicola]
MPRIQSIAPLLRPLAAPRVTACRQHSRFSTATRLRAETPSQSVQPIKPSKAPATSRAADLAATEAVTESDSAQPPEPKPELPSKRSRDSATSRASKPKTTSSRADDVPTPPATPSASSPANTQSALKQASIPKRADAVPTPPPTSKPNTKASLKSTTPPSPNLPLSPPRYHVSRSASKNLPIYTDYKRGGNLHLTTVRKITGDLSALRDELRVYLNKKNEDVKINDLTKHVIVKGHCKPEVQRFLEARGM